MRKQEEPKDDESEEPKTTSKGKENKPDKDKFKPGSRSKKEKKNDKEQKEKRTEKENNPISKSSESSSATPSSTFSTSSPSSTNDNLDKNPQTSSTPSLTVRSTPLITNSSPEAPSTTSLACSAESTPSQQESETATPSMLPSSPEQSSTSLCGDRALKTEKISGASEIAIGGNEGGEKGRGKNRYDSKRFKGNLMPIRKKVHSGPGGIWQENESKNPSTASGSSEGGDGNGRNRHDSKGFKENLMPIRKQARPKPSFGRQR